ncbi:tight junction-associated protein 1-like isoform X1 [Limulus polyphemus]|uniref:Tight junction-associated protein 1-like isoform X1 n=1 Tax=Limulus polyphemus TaxID=6850 RepID=A0ABM1T3I4_LIMPO|nr:tight junction-associated protein 1-like isoform X1 [Limulus polyphemus]
MDRRSNISVMTVLPLSQPRCKQWQECGCICDSCVNNNSLHLHQEIEQLKCQLLEREYHIVQMDTSVINHAQQFPNGEWEALRQELLLWQEKYQRLHESHKKLQKVNQGLEDKLLKIVDKYETEKAALTRDLSDMTTKLVEARFTITELEEENDQYRNDCNTAVQLLQCKPSNFVSHKYSSIPLDLQERVKSHLSHRMKREIQNNNPEVRTIRVPIPTFPPTAMVYSVNKIPDNGTVKQKETTLGISESSPDYVSAAIMAKVLEERAKERNAKKQFICMACKFKKQCVYYQDKETQTKWPSTFVSCLSCGNQPIDVHSRVRRGSSSGTDSQWHQSRTSSVGGTETII